MGGTWLLRKKPPCATINKCIGIDQKTEKLNRCNIRSTAQVLAVRVLRFTMTVEKNTAVVNRAVP